MRRTDFSSITWLLSYFGFCSLKLQIISGNSNAKERVLQRIEPWIKRELYAILHDPDPAVIVHVATSLFISSLEENTASGYLSGEDDFLAPLRSFLHDQANTFWHELRYINI